MILNVSQLQTVIAKKYGAMGHGMARARRYAKLDIAGLAGNLKNEGNGFIDGEGLHINTGALSEFAEAVENAKTSSN